MTHVDHGSGLHLTKLIAWHSTPIGRTDDGRSFFYSLDGIVYRTTGGTGPIVKVADYDEFMGSVRDTFPTFIHFRSGGWGEHKRHLIQVHGPEDTWGKA